MISISRLPFVCFVYFVVAGLVTHFNSSTTTDFAGSLAVKPLSVSLQSLNAAGFTVSGASKVLCACIASAVSTRPETLCGFAPCKSQVTSASAFGFRLQSET